MDYRQFAADLLDEWESVNSTRPRLHVVELQIEKDSCSKLAVSLSNLLAWGTDSDVEEACKKFAPMLAKIKEKIVFEILKNGTIYKSDRKP